MAHRPIAATLLSVVVLARPAVAEQSAPPVPPDAERSYTAYGALIGAVAMGAIPIADLKACRTGCEASGSALLMIGLAAGVGALAGGGFGYAAGRYADPARVRSANPHFPDRPAVRLGALVGRTSFRSPLLEGTGIGSGFALGFDVWPYVSAHIEFTGKQGTFVAAPDAIPESVLSNVVPASSRRAGRSFGIASQRIDFVLSEFIGIHPRPWGRVRVEFLAGLAVRGGEERSYYEEFQTSGQTSEPTGKYYILNFESPDNGIVLGADAEVVVARGLSVVPTVRYQRFGRPGPTVNYGVGAHWRF